MYLETRIFYFRTAVLHKTQLYKPLPRYVQITNRNRILSHTNFFKKNDKKNRSRNRITFTMGCLPRKGDGWDPEDSQGGDRLCFARAPLSNVFLMRRHQDTWKRSEKETWETMAGTLIWRALDRTLLLPALFRRRTLCYCHLFFHAFFWLPAPGLSATLMRGFKERKGEWRKRFDWLQNSYWPLLDIIFTPLPSYKRNGGKRVRIEPAAWEKCLSSLYASLLFLFLTPCHLCVLTFFAIYATVRIRKVISRLK